MLHDDFLQNKKDNEILKYCEEGKLCFDPTYKYDIRTNNYDTSAKQRTPAWCDRVIYDKRDHLASGGGWDLKYYNRAEISLSDHKPVCAIFDASVCKINWVVRERIEKELLTNFSKF